jgi:hypothetical protein
MSMAENTPMAQGPRSIFGLPVETQVLFSNRKGTYKKSIERRKTKLLAKIACLRKFLDPDETILYLTTACSPFSFMEQITTPQLLFLLMKRALLVFTNKRILHVATKTDYGYRGSIAQILYEDCNRLEVKWGQLVVEYRTGKKEKFPYIPWADGAKLKQMQIQPTPAEVPSPRPQRNPLCPRCMEMLTADTYTCASCGLEFKNKAGALLYSVLLPGGGYFYTRRWVMGLMDGLVESYLLLGTLATLVLWLLGEAQMLSAFVFLGLLLTVEKLMTIFHTYHAIGEFLPKDLRQLLVEAPAPAPAVAPAPQLELRQRRLEDVLSVR